MKFKTIYDESNHCYVIDLNGQSSITIPEVLRSIRACCRESWSHLKNFIGYKNVFDITYCRDQGKDIEALQNLLIVDEDKGQARFFHKDHKPTETTYPYLGPSLINGEPATCALHENVPTRVTSRVVIKDPLDRTLDLSLAVAGGFLIHNDMKLINPNTTYRLSGTFNALNRFLRDVRFVGTVGGDGSITITVDDRGGEPESVVTTTVNFTVEEAPRASVPVPSVPESTKATAVGQPVTLPAISVEDTDGKAITVDLAAFGCKIFGITSNPIIITEESKGYTFTDTPDGVNTKLAALQVIPLKPTAYVGVRMSCPNFKTLKYIKIESPDTEEPTEPVAPDVPAFEGDPDPITGNVGVNLPEEPITGQKGSVHSLAGLTFAGSWEEPVGVKFTAHGCTLRGADGKDIMEVAINGDMNKLNEFMKSLSVVCGDTSGFFSIEYTTDHYIQFSVDVNVVEEVQVAAMRVAPVSASQSGAFSGHNESADATTFNVTDESTGTTAVDSHVDFHFDAKATLKYYSLTADGDNIPTAWELYALNSSGTKTVKLIASETNQATLTEKTIPGGDMTRAHYRIVFKAFKDPDAKVANVGVVFKSPEKTELVPVAKS